MQSKKPIYITKANGDTELFDQSKLENSLKRAGASLDSIKYILNKIESTLKPGVSTKVIYRKAFDLLNKREQPVALKYSLKNAVMDLGPSGFPFEEFIASIMRKRGYEAEVGVTIQGKCTEHEVDVIAYNDNELIMIEAKFHNQPGVKTDTKVALYVKARFDDLSDISFVIGGKDRKLSQGWLMTNTKFTKGAIRYGECQNMKMIGWSYPQNENLQDLIEQSGLHPLTCLNALSQKQKELILNQGTVLCRDIFENQPLLKSIGLSDRKINEVQKEASTLCQVD